MASSLPASGISCTLSFDDINGLLYSLSSSLNALFRRIVTSHHARISPTAKLAAFLRAETDIPYCRQIAEMCDAEEVSRTFNPGFIANHRAYIELRFKSLNAFVHRLGFRQVLEFAGGVAPPSLTGADLDRLILIHIAGLKDDHIATLVRTWHFSIYGRDLSPDDAKRVAPKLFGHPVAARLVAGLLGDHSVDFLEQYPREIISLRR